jgi:tetratricopeptide (TPR) repeat protein
MAVSGCQPKSSKTQTERDLRQEEKMMAMISIARSYHQRASIAQKMGKNDDALREIDMILAMSFTKGFRPGEELLLDAWARKATMLLEMEQPKMALDTIQQAITRPTWLGNSFYIAHLFHVKGRILEALQQPEQALAAYQRSIELNKAVIQEILQSQNQGSK